MNPHHHRTERSRMPTAAERERGNIANRISHAENVIAGRGRLPGSIAPPVSSDQEPRATNEANVRPEYAVPDWMYVGAPVAWRYERKTTAPVAVAGIILKIGQKTVRVKILMQIGTRWSFRSKTVPPESLSPRGYAVAEFGEREKS